LQTFNENWRALVMAMWRLITDNFVAQFFVRLTAEILRFAQDDSALLL
jgi:hypothetical protein